MRSAILDGVAKHPVFPRKRDRPRLRQPNAYCIIAMQRGALTACEDLSFGLQMRPYKGKRSKIGNTRC